MWVACEKGTFNFIAAFPKYYTREDCEKTLSELGLQTSEYSLCFDEDYPNNSVNYNF